MSKLNYISVAGYGSTGSSAVVNLLEEVENCSVIGGEFRFIQDPDGLEDLCFNLTHSWGWVRSDAFVRRFIRYTDILGRDPNYFQFGERLDILFNNKFIKYRNEFIDSIVDTKWKGYWFYHDYHERNAIQTFIEKIKRYTRRFGVDKKTIRKITKKTDMYFVRSDKDIYKYAKLFINNLFDEYISNHKNTNIVLDQLILPYNRGKFELLFDGLKQIVVDRDPRDVYLDAMTYNAYPITDDINTFISFYETSRNVESINGDGSKILFVKFEDLVLNYDNEVKRIFDFLDIDSSSHVRIKSRFNPDISIKNTQTWKRSEFDKYRIEIDAIEEKLKKYCYDFK
ncbi:sulfotransferase domain-containing protein [Vibrio furnissii]|uniref:sulfotransferase domain-containing protein n=1 Tax=Vibrio furnissii TaxID=29494 RepID=UPI001EE9B765|nr:sulfotransferase domain-containing protein [Vibrio furnissii]MCG6232996.1 sulfotransferase domain-containing protein [Vibrio furnissii]MCG6258800.1 sulfotransferase domain-containing protein [Vibrio furnissii]